jgi:hypothetical protein
MSSTLVHTDVMPEHSYVEVNLWKGLCGVDLVYEGG